MSPSIDAAIQQFTPGLPLAVALSGGADSTALLLACAQRWPNQVIAMHVNHGLQQAAGAFEAHCQALCARLGVPLTVAHVHVCAAPGQSPEDAARIARYRALDRLADAAHQGKRIASVALAQHADDQVETVLLALGRGAGLAGLSAMPAHWIRLGLDFYRPLLGVSAVEIRRWLAARSEGFMEDPSNADEAFLRNRIRARLMPALREVFPHYAQTMPRSAGHAAQGQALLTEIAAADWLSVCDECGTAPQIKRLQTLGRARQANVLRHWLVQHCHTQASSAQLQELMRQIAACTTRGHRIEIRVGHGFVQRSNTVLAWYNFKA
jgi:tRNA(Ile)-lysidine synthase